MYFQTLVMAFKDLTPHFDDEIDFKPTNFDELVMDFIESIYDDEQVASSISINVLQDKIVAIIQYRKGTSQELHAFKLIRSGEQTKIAPINVTDINVTDINLPGKPAG